MTTIQKKKAIEIIARRMRRNKSIIKRLMKVTTKPYNLKKDKKAIKIVILTMRNITDIGKIKCILATVERPKRLTGGAMYNLSRNNIFTPGEYDQLPVKEIVSVSDDHRITHKVFNGKIYINAIKKMNESMNNLSKAAEENSNQFKGLATQATLLINRLPKEL